MPVLRRKLPLTCVAGAASGTLNAGAPNGRLLRVTQYTVSNGHDTDVSVKDSEGRNVFSKLAWDYDASTLILDGTTYTSLAVDSGMIGEMLVESTDGTTSSSFSTGVSFHGPLTVSLANGGSASVILVFEIEV